MSVRCVVSVSTVMEHANYYKRNTPYKGNMKTITMAPIGSQGAGVPEELKDEVRKFWEASPSGEFKLGTVNPEAAAFFEIDGIYEVTFTKIGQIERPD